MDYKIFNGEKFIGTSKYALVVGVSKRARQLMSGEEPQINPQGHKAVVVALKEIEQERVFLTLQKRAVEALEVDISEDAILPEGEAEEEAGAVE